MEHHSHYLYLQSVKCLDETERSQNLLSEIRRQTVLFLVEMKNEVCFFLHFMWLCDRPLPWLTLKHIKVKLYRCYRKTRWDSS